MQGFPPSKQSRNNYFYNGSQQQQLMTFQGDFCPQVIYETQIQQQMKRPSNKKKGGQSQFHSMIQNSSSSVPKTLSCVFQQQSIRNSSQKQLPRHNNTQAETSFTLNPKQESSRLKGKCKSLNLPQPPVFNNKQQSRQQLQLTATDYQLFTSDEELDKALSSSKQINQEEIDNDCEADFEATLMSFHNFRSVKRMGINRLHPETIESLVMNNNNNYDSTCHQQQHQSMSNFNSAGKSSLKKQNSIGSGTKKAVSYLSDFYSLIPIVNMQQMQQQQQNKFNMEGTDKSMFEETLAYEPVHQIMQQSRPDFISFQDIQQERQQQQSSRRSRNQHKELKGRALSAAAVAHGIPSHTIAPRRLQFTENQTNQMQDLDEQYRLIQQMRNQITEYESLLKNKDLYIYGLEEQINFMDDKLRNANQNQSNTQQEIMVKDELIQRLQAQVEDLITSNESALMQWEQERQSMLQIQEQVSRVCNEQLQSFYELNKKSEIVIERLEQELKQAQKSHEKTYGELERANKVINQQHEMYYRLYHRGEQQNSIDNLMRSHESVSYNQEEYTPAKPLTINNSQHNRSSIQRQQLQSANKQSSIDRERLIKSTTSMKKSRLSQQKENVYQQPLSDTGHVIGNYQIIPNQGGSRNSHLSLNAKTTLKSSKQQQRPQSAQFYSTNNNNKNLMMAAMLKQHQLQQLL